VIAPQGGGSITSFALARADRFADLGNRTPSYETIMCRVNSEAIVDHLSAQFERALEVALREVDPNSKADPYKFLLPARTTEAADSLRSLTATMIGAPQQDAFC
jgi:hypothetical protein